MRASSRLSSQRLHHGVGAMHRMQSALGTGSMLALALLRPRCRRPAHPESLRKPARRRRSCWASPCIRISAPPGPKPLHLRRSDSPPPPAPPSVRKASRIPGTARIGPMLVTGLLGANTIASADAIALEHSRRRSRLLRAFEAHRAAPRPGGARAQSIPGNVSVPFAVSSMVETRSSDMGSTRARIPIFARKLRRRLGQRLSRAQQGSARQVRRQIEIAEAEPRRLAQAASCAPGSGS